MALKVIGAGLGRTGTLSLKYALEHLGFGPCYHMGEVLGDTGGTLPLWLDVVRGKPDWERIFAKYRSTTDYPACTYWRELLDLYPDAKVVLSTRDPDSWFDSVSATIFSAGMRQKFEGTPVKEFIVGTSIGPFGDRIGDRAFMTDWFRRWEEDVIARTPADKLLVYRVSEGWEPLCRFLDAPVPDIPFPRVNSKDDMQEYVSTEIASLEELETFHRSYESSRKHDT